MKTYGIWLQHMDQSHQNRLIPCSLVFPLVRSVWLPKSGPTFCLWLQAHAGQVNTEESIDEKVVRYAYPESILPNAWGSTSNKNNYQIGEY
jgi:hypothetical protein